MFSGGFSIWHWMIVLVIVVVVFGTKKLRNAGGDLGAAVKNFKSAMKEGEQEAGRPDKPSDAIEGESRPVPPASTTAPSRSDKA